MLMETILLCIKYNNSFLFGKPQKPKQTFWPTHYFYFFWSVFKPEVSVFPPLKFCSSYLRGTYHHKGAEIDNIQFF